LRTVSWRSLAESRLIDSGLLTRRLTTLINAGADYEVVRVVGSQSDDGPRPELGMDMIGAQPGFMGMAKRASLVIVLSTVLCSVPAWVKTKCVDINPAVVTKLSHRGSGQTIGIVSDVGLFLRFLAEKLQR